MKLLILFALCAFSQTAFSQIDQDESVKNRLEELYREGLDGEKLRRFTLPQKPGGVYEQQLDVAGSRKPGIYSLPQDRMPCIVPDTGGLVAIPNAFPTAVVPFKTTIPNAYEGPSLKKITKD
jgi:hypothetical protein